MSSRGEHPKDANRDNRRVIRVRLQTPLKVTVGSIGSPVRYALQSRDISNSGFFLDFDKPGRFPFIASSIMEVWMQLPDEQIIFFNGKLARTVFPNDGAAQVSGPGIGIRIIQIAPEQEKKLIHFISTALTNQDNEQPGPNSPHVDTSDEAS